MTNGRILVVEDDARIARLHKFHVKQFLQRDVDITADYDTALGFTRINDYDFHILDGNFFENPMNTKKRPLGIPLALEIEARRPEARGRIVLYSSDEAVLDGAKKLGIWAYDKSSHTPQDFYSKIKRKIEELAPRDFKPLLI